MALRTAVRVLCPRSPVAIASTRASRFFSKSEQYAKPVRRGTKKKLSEESSGKISRSPAIPPRTLLSFPLPRSLKAPFKFFFASFRPWKHVERSMSMKKAGSRVYDPRRFSFERAVPRDLCRLCPGPLLQDRLLASRSGTAQQARAQPGQPGALAVRAKDPLSRIAATSHLLDVLELLPPASLDHEGLPRSAQPPPTHRVDEDIRHFACGPSLLALADLVETANALLVQSLAKSAFCVSESAQARAASSRHGGLSSRPPRTATDLLLGAAVSPTFCGF
eukprot:scaffold1352_cov261-Pinguiococcus_pyrenoidosus.AAC.5